MTSVSTQGRSGPIMECSSSVFQGIFVDLHCVCSSRYGHQLEHFQGVLNLDLVVQVVVVVVVVV